MEEELSDDTTIFNKTDYWLKKIWKHNLHILNGIVVEKDPPTFEAKIDSTLEVKLCEIFKNQNWVKRQHTTTIKMAVNEESLQKLLNLNPAVYLNPKQKKSVLPHLWNYPDKFVIMGGENELHLFVNTQVHVGKEFEWNFGKIGPFIA